MILFFKTLVLISGADGVCLSPFHFLAVANRGSFTPYRGGYRKTFGMQCMYAHNTVAFP